VLAHRQLGLDPEHRQLGLDRRQRTLELRLRLGVDEDGVEVARDRESLVAEAARELVGVGVDEPGWPSNPWRPRRRARSSRQSSWAMREP
jgi:hypothetical protein